MLKEKSQAPCDWYVHNETQISMLDSCKQKHLHKLKIIRYSQNLNVKVDLLQVWKNWLLQNSNRQIINQAAPKCETTSALWSARVHYTHQLHERLKNEVV